ncbi:NAD(P)H-dependent flavin oxidoreductase [Bacillus sp. FJAT-45350]|uniref:NAD(P)H-dependent flavin oxidoreductase n=1 Tax=Bacillus sp. FJAT-45350 TaxID=2011014 RepID=UPI000BB91E0B|nr:nitronate monooxygenase [Bacillus sp. FJAT-45350]
MFKNHVTELLKIEHPIIQAPMAGGITSSALVSAASNAGTLGMIGAGYMNASQIKQQIQEVRNMTKYNFGVNIFIPSEFTITENELQIANELLQPFRDELVIKDDNPQIATAEEGFSTFYEQVKVVRDEKVPVCSFTFGLPPKDIINELRENGTIVIGTATTVEEAILNEKAGMDIVVVQGSEAGGHRGTFTGDCDSGMIGLMSLIPQVADAVTIPVIAAGGIMDGRGLMAAFCLGAQAVQMGSAFLTCKESGAHQVYKKALLEAKENDTTLTKAFSGKSARGIQNEFIEKMKDIECELPSYPVQNTLTSAIRKASVGQNNPQYMSLWSGQSPRLAKDQTVDDLVTNVMKQANVLLKK